VQLADSIYWAVIVACGGIAVAGTAMWYTARRSDPDRLPEARLRAPSARLRATLPPVIAAIAGAIALVMWLGGHHVAIVRDDGSGLAVERVIRLGEPDVPLAPGSDDRHRDVSIVNTSHRTVSYQDVVYGSLFNGDGTAIPPGTRLMVNRLDFVGPDDKPPQVIAADQVEGEMSFASRGWLTW